ncbi:MAG: hypothetical protein R3C29_07770 [Dehalococcoidia bacterium]
MKTSMVLCLVLLGSVVSGCESSSDTDWLPRYAGEVNGDDGSVEGVLRRDGLCLYIEVEPSNFRWLPVFPTHRVWFSSDDNALTVDRQQTHVGEYLFLGGSGLESAVYEDVDWARQPDESCDSNNLWFVGLFDD